MMRVSVTTGCILLRKNETKARAIQFKHELRAHGMDPKAGHSSSVGCVYVVLLTPNFLASTHCQSRLSNPDIITPACKRAAENQILPALSTNLNLMAVADIPA